MSMDLFLKVAPIGFMIVVAMYLITAFAYAMQDLINKGALKK